MSSRNATKPIFANVYSATSRQGHHFDIGANNGFKTETFSRLGAVVIAIEPDRHSAETLRKTFRSWDGISIVEKRYRKRQEKKPSTVSKQGPHTTLFRKNGPILS
jgi:FkbM family methyltransferase